MERGLKVEKTHRTSLVLLDEYHYRALARLSLAVISSLCHREIMTDLFYSA
ncbi:hypothetical protein J6590_056637 [Homalodisca vitripennis]|nr:hypothetical protein J6590_056637 [Homalodisca vitripennis]